MQTVITSQKIEQYLQAMVLVEEISKRLNVTSYIWGGFVVDIFAGQFLRNHSDIDYFVIELHTLSGQWRQLLSNAGWQVKEMLNRHLLSAKKSGIKLHLGHIEVNQEVNWKHNGKNGTISFPTGWLRGIPIQFYNVLVHCVEPELNYVLKTNPNLMNPAWIPRKKDGADIKILEGILLKKNINLNTLVPAVKSF